MTRAQSSVRRPTTAPIMSRGGPVVCFSGRIRCRMRPTHPLANTATATANANFAEFKFRPPLAMTRMPRQTRNPAQLGAIRAPEIRRRPKRAALCPGLPGR